MTGKATLLTILFLGSMGAFELFSARPSFRNGQRHRPPEKTGLSNPRNMCSHKAFEQHVHSCAQRTLKVGGLLLILLLSSEVLRMQHQMLLASEHSQVKRIFACKEFVFACGIAKADCCPGTACHVGHGCDLPTGTVFVRVCERTENLDTLEGATIAPIEGCELNQVQFINEQAYRDARAAEEHYFAGGAPLRTCMRLEPVPDGDSCTRTSEQYRMNEWRYEGDE